MKQIFFDTYGYFIFAYSMVLMSSYVLLIWLAYVSFKRRSLSMHDMPYVRRVFRESEYLPGVSIVAPAYNEEKTIFTNVTSLLQQDYPKFEVVIVNDGSTDKTLQIMIDKFNLEEVPYDYVELVQAKPFKRLFRSRTHPNLVVVDKENGGTKADAVNGGLNVAKYRYFVNTDVDCILDKDAIYNCIRPVLEKPDVIAVSGVMSMSNGCEVNEQGEIVKKAAPWSPLPLFQAGEYMRSFLVGKMGWSAINAMNNVSGGYGLFDRAVVIAAGGYGSTSFAEDMDMLTRMIAYCCDTGRKYRVVQIPDTCCWTEGPASLRVLMRQRVRWGRGLVQTFMQHHRMVFNPRYGRMGLLTLPYTMIFELFAPVIEFIGFIIMIYLLYTGGINFATAVVMLALVFLFGLFLAAMVILYDYQAGSSYNDRTSYLRQFFASIFEPFIFHPLIVCFSLKGYWNYFTRKKASWGKMSRKGVHTTKQAQK